jgi:hypothetical protein
MAKMLCKECSKVAYKPDMWDNWLKIVHFVEFLRNQEMISEATCQDILDTILWFKP